MDIRALFLRPGSGEFRAFSARRGKGRSDGQSCQDRRAGFPFVYGVIHGLLNEDIFHERGERWIWQGRAQNPNIILIHLYFYQDLP